MTPASLRGENHALRSELITLRLLRQQDQQKIKELELLLIKNGVPLRTPIEMERKDNAYP